MVLQSWFYFSLRLIVTGLLLPVAVALGGAWFRQGKRGIFYVWSRWWYWVAVIMCGWIGFGVTGRLMGLTSGHGLMGETLSLLVRLGLAFTLDVFLACFVTALAAVGLRRGVGDSAV